MSSFRPMHAGSLAAAGMVALLSLFAAAAGGAAANAWRAQRTRPFYMGFTPFPYDVTTEAVEWTYERVLEHGDLIAHHLDTGVPWPEALAGSPYPPLVQNEIESRVVRTPDSQVVYLALTPLSQFRDGLAAYWSDQGAVPPPGPWARRAFDHPKVVEAYTAYCLELIDRLEPDYVAYGIEVDLLAANDPDAFEAFKRLARKVYRKIKRRHSDLPLFLTFTLGQPGEWETKKKVMAPLLPYTDLLAISTYPFLAVGFDGDPNRIPAEWFTRIRELDPDKPIAVAETSHAAETLTLDGFGVSIPGRKSWQKVFAKRLLRDASALDMEFVVWFSIVDYDALWEVAAAMGASEIFKAWRDTGLYDQNLRPRPALKRWSKYLRRRRVAASDSP
ncbi:MAG: hypothetical protein GY769_21940 [bacterium]|nr:hypothetical protein [bacterium]